MINYKELTFTLDTRVVTFYDCALVACEMPEFAEQMDRLFGTHIMRAIKAKGIVKEIDRVTGYADSQMEKFLALVWETVWLRIDPKIKIRYPEYEKMLYDRYKPVLKELMS